MKHNFTTARLNVNSFKPLRQIHFFQPLGIPKLILLLLAGMFYQHLLAQPIITSFSPLSGLPGSTVTIYGSGFSANPSENIVFIGASYANALTASPDKLTVRVPRSTTNKAISVTTNSLTGFSSVPFITTFKTGNVITQSAFETPKNFPMITSANIQKGLTIEDLDNDGKPDIFFNGTFGQLSDFKTIFRNTSTPGILSFGPEIFPNVPFFDEGNTTVFLPGDLDGDGKKDIFSRNNDHLDILKNNSSPGNISFQSTYSIPLDQIDNIYYFGTADLNADGKLDLFGIDVYHEDSASFTRNTSSGGTISFAPPVFFPFNFLRSPYSFADFNGDGRTDILYVTNDGGTELISVCINASSNGNVSYNSPKNIFPASSNAVLGVADINKDGKPDIAISSVKKDSLYFLVNNSSGGTLSFAPPVSFPYGLNTQNAHIVDIDGDGKIDICANESSTGNYIILKNTSTLKRLSFAAPVSFPAIKASDVEFCDFDGDGKQDLAHSLKDYLSFISIYRNQTDTATGIPSITSFSPATATQYDTLTIAGDNLSGTTNITLGGTAVQSFKVVSNNKITAVVNTGSSGDLQVTTLKGVATKSSFTYITDTTVKLVSTYSGIACSEKIIRVKAVVTNADHGIFYNWYRNGKLDIISGNIYSSHTLKDGDSVWCIVSFSRDSGHKEWKSDTIKFHINLSRSLKLRIQSSKGTLICKGTSVVFNAVVGNGEFSPVFQWKKNDHVVGDSSDTYSDNQLKNGDTITCTMVRAQECAVLPPAASLVMTVNDSKPSAPSMIIGPDKVTPSQAGVIFSVPKNPDIISYKWQIPTGVSLTSVNGKDSIIVTWSNTTGKISVGASNACGVSPVITKTVQVMSGNARIAKNDINNQIANDATSLAVYPNPATSNATVVFTANGNNYNILEFRDPNGALLWHQKIQTQKGQMRADINTSTLASGVYYILLIDESNKAISKRLIIAK